MASVGLPCRCITSELQWGFAQRGRRGGRLWGLAATIWQPVVWVPQPGLTPCRWSPGPARSPPPPPTFRGMPRVALSLWPHPGVSSLTGAPQSSHTPASAHLSSRQAPSRWAGGQVGRGRSHCSQLGPGFWLLAPVPFLFARPGWPRRSPQASPTPTARCLSGWIERTLPALRRRSTAPQSHTCQLGLAAPCHENLLAGKWGPEVWPRNRSE